MKIKKLVMLIAFPFFVSSCATNNVLATGDELVRNELCGKLVDYGSDSCEFVKEINLHGAVRREEYNDITRNAVLEIDEILKQWEVENNKKYMDKNISIFHKTKRAPLDKDYGPDGALNIYFWVVEVKKKRMLDVIFFSKSRYSNIVTSRQCDLDINLNSCLREVVNELLENKVSAQIFNYRQYETLK